MKELVLGLFLSPRDAAKARIHLKDAGVKRHKIAVIKRANRLSRLRTVRKHLIGEGALTGGILGGLAGLLIAATPMVLPGMEFLFVGPFFILIGFLLGAGIGGIFGAFVNLGMSVNQIKKYKQRIKAGGVLLATPVEDEKVEKAQEIMQDFKAEEHTIIPYSATKGFI